MDKRTGKAVFKDVPLILNPPDRVAVEAALRLRDTHGGKVSIISMGRSEAEDTLRGALAMGADEAFLLCDETFKDDPHVTAFVLAKAAEKIRDFDLILCGRRSFDGNNVQVGPQLAGLLTLPVVTEVERIEVSNGKIVVEERLILGVRVVELPLPALVTLTEDAYKARHPSSWDIYEAYHIKSVTMWTRKDLGVDERSEEIENPPIQTRRIFQIEEEKRRETLSGTLDEVAKDLAKRLIRFRRVV
ncbi:MAG: electron transfer flavoprotein subunit beta [Nitrososphaeria archaeon]|nr:electron transfer flavoprotein subunit beta [Nitrososphaeria archaeon]NIQ33474.1 electron transfer flavoprotein subunit beta [Nitrososphaeria archaeon]